MDLLIKNIIIYLKQFESEDKYNLKTKKCLTLFKVKVTVLCGLLFYCAQFSKRA